MKVDVTYFKQFEMFFEQWVLSQSQGFMTRHEQSVSIATGDVQYSRVIE